MIGVYFSANDRVYDWVVAFLESYREFNPDLPLRLIPFNDQCEKVSRLASTYRFEIHTDHHFKELEEIGRSLELGITPTGPFWFRRFVAFWGPFESFFYLDARTIVLTNLAPILEEFQRSPFDLWHYDCALDQVYNAGTFRQDFLLKGKARGFNSGRWVAKKAIFGIEELQQYGAECVAIREHLNARNTDQFFLNYCFDRSCRPIANMAEVLGGMCSSGWSRQYGSVYRDGVDFRRWDHGGNDHKKVVPLLHWAGIPLSCSMPEAELFFTFRDRRSTGPYRLWRKLSRIVPRIMGHRLAAMRRNRILNTYWHRLKSR